VTANANRFVKRGYRAGVPFWAGHAFSFDLFLGKRRSHNVLTALVPVGKLLGGNVEMYEPISKTMPHFFHSSIWDEERSLISFARYRVSELTKSIGSKLLRYSIEFLSSAFRKAVPVHSPIYRYRVAPLYLDRV
jgi:hypothetical protein